jgi:hypothetical protein
VSLRASKITVAICGILGAWFGMWIGQPTISVRYWAVPPTTSTGTNDFAWWSKYFNWPGEAVQRRLAYFGDQTLFPFWRFVLSIGMAVLFAYIATLVVTRIPVWRLSAVLRNGTQARATVVRVLKTGQEAQGPAGVECQMAVELSVCWEAGSPYRARTTQFFSESAQRALQPGAGVMVRYDPAKPLRVAIVKTEAD